MLKVPPPVRRLFQVFPLKTYPGTEPVESEEIETVLPTLYVHNLDKDGLSMDPECRELQYLAKLLQVQLTVKEGSIHVSSSNSLPYLYEKKNGKVQVYTSTRAIVSRLVGSEMPSHNEIYRSLIETSLGDAWVYTLLSNEYQDAKLKVYLPGLESELPSLVRSLRSAEVSALLLKRLETRYAFYVSAARSRNPLSSVPDIGDEIHARAEECLRVCENKLQKDQSLDNGPLDALLVSYINCISQLIPESKLRGLVPDSLIEYSTKLH